MGWVSDTVQEDDSGGCEGVVEPHPDAHQFAFVRGGGDDVESCAGGEKGQWRVGAGLWAGGHDEDGVVVGEVADAGSERAVERRLLS